MGLTEREIRRMIREIIEERMSGFPRVHNMMTGNVDSINTIGMMTSENPMAQQLTHKENKKRLSDLKEDLRNLNLGFIPIDGTYGVKENALVIPNIKREDLINLGEKYKQDSVIFGQKKNDNGKIVFLWEFIKRGDVVKTSNIVITNSEALETADDFYSAIKNRRFAIPFDDVSITNNFITD